MTACIIMNRHSKHLKQLGILFSLVLCVISNYSCSGGTNKFRLSEDCQQIDSLKNIVLQVFLENSGSMNGYMIAGSEFKDAVYDLASALSSRCDTTELFFVNSMISMYSQSLESFVRDMSPQLFQQFPGNRMNSDLADVIAQVIAKTDLSYYENNIDKEINALYLIADDKYNTYDNNEGGATQRDQAIQANVKLQVIRNDFGHHPAVARTFHMLDSIYYEPIPPQP